MKKLVFLVLAIISMLAFSAVVKAEYQLGPVGPDVLNELSTGRHADNAAKTHNAYAGNVTEIFMNVTTSTQGWQGYYGNVTGVITLDDSSNNTMYDWALANPEGEVYASTSSISNWDNVACAGVENISYHENSTYNFNKYANGTLKADHDIDGIGETFNESFGGDFYVGSTRINSTSSCKAAYLYVNSAPDTAAKTFTEVLLQDTSGLNGALIYTSILVQNSASGFDNRNHDFQMIVGEDGHNGNELTTLYYFYVEIA